MFVEYNTYVGLRDINSLQELKNTSLLSYLENVACMHSEMAGFGVTTMHETKRTWVLLSWKIKVLKRPKFNDNLRIKTWSRCIEKFYAYRDFEVYNNNELVCIATSKWVFIDIEKEKLIKVPDDIASRYNPESEYKVFEEKDLPKLSSPENNLREIKYKITRNMIDVNNHLHNIYYMDIALEALPSDISISNEFNEFEIMYKKEVKLGENVRAIYSKDDEYHYVTIKSENNELHAIIRLK